MLTSPIMQSPLRTKWSLRESVLSSPAAAGGATRRSAAAVVVHYGIPNYGLTCFLNSVLQALASLEPFMVFLEHLVELKLEVVSQSHPQFKAQYGAVMNTEQQDAQELLQAALGMVVAEGQFELTPAVAAPSTMVASFLTIQQHQQHHRDDAESVTLATALLEMRMKGERRLAPFSPVTAYLAESAIVTSNVGSCAVGDGARSYSPKSTLPPWMNWVQP